VFRLLLAVARRGLLMPTVMSVSVVTCFLGGCLLRATLESDKVEILPWTRDTVYLFLVKQPIDLLAIRPACTTCNAVSILARPSGQRAS
jgi:hypothetical protein